jgi:hypothetical protein
MALNKQEVLIILNFLTGCLLTRSGRHSVSCSTFLLFKYLLLGARREASHTIVYHTWFESLKTNKLAYTRAREANRCGTIITIPYPRGKLVRLYSITFFDRYREKNNCITTDGNSFWWIITYFLYHYSLPRMFNCVIIMYSKIICLFYF